MRNLTCSHIVSVLAVVCSIASTPVLAQDTSFNLPEQSLADSLRQVAGQTNSNILFNAKEVAGLSARALRAEMTQEQVLRELLRGTGLVFVYLNERTVQIIPMGAAPASKGRDSAAWSREAQRNSLGGQFELAKASAQSDQATSENSSQTGPRSSTPQSRSDDIQEIVVTAQKREERLQDVPMSISVLSGERLSSLQVNSLDDLAGYVPGMTVLSGGRPGARSIILRGVSTGGSPTSPALVGTYVDDIPLGSSGPAGRPEIWGLDLMPYDFSGIEVLKGPQGTLYGANSMGGLVKYTLRKPSLTEFEARVGSNIETADHSDGTTWAARAAVSAPIVAGKLGLRLSGFYRDDAGYTDNALINKKDVDNSKQKGGLALLLWQPTEALAVRATMMRQDSDGADQSFVDVDPITQQPLYGRYIYGSQVASPAASETSLYAIGVDWDLSFGRLTSSTSWSELAFDYADDQSRFFGPLCAAFCPDYPFADALARFDGTLETKKFTQEIRLASTAAQKVEWMVGGYYTDESIHETQSLPTLTPDLEELPPRNNLFTAVNDGDYEEMAAFVNGRYKFTDRVDVGGGVRYSRYKLQNGISPIGGPFGAGTVAETTTLSPQNVTTWMGDVRYFVKPDVMVYGRVSTSYRPGNRTAALPIIGYSGIVHPDQTKNYELGLKGAFLEGRVGFDFALFSIDWTDIQLAQSVSGLTFSGNGGEARSRGVELGATYFPIQNLQVIGAVTYTDAQLTQDAPGVRGVDGDQLPNSPEWAGSLTVDYSRQLGYATRLLLGSGYRYRGSIPGGFGLFRTQLESRETVDAYVGLNVAATDIRLYAKNVLGDYAGFTVGPGWIKGIVNPPRTFILSVDYSF